jgi:hypothetical protein
MSFLRTLPPLMRTVHRSKPSTLNFGVFSDGLPEMKLQVIGMSILIIPIKPWAGMLHLSQPKIIPYYHLSLSTWPLTNNKELLCRFCRVKPGESLTTGSRYALSPHEGGTRVQHYIT